jgi:hypothetical protein
MTAYFRGSYRSIWSNNKIITLYRKKCLHDTLSNTYMNYPGTELGFVYLHSG